MQLHDKQQEIARSIARFKIIRAGRRSGKTTLEIEEMLFCAISEGNRNVFYIAPTQIQARKIIWEALKSRLNGIGEINESRLEIRIPTKDKGISTIYVSGWENRENFRGMKAHLIVFDELDTMKDFFIGWQEIFRPALTDTMGKANFIGTPKRENPNLRRLEKIAETDIDYEFFHFKTEDNPHIPKTELKKAEEELDYDTYRQEYLAEYIDNQGSLFKYDAIVDTFTNTITKTSEKYLIIDVSGPKEGNDKTKFSYWEGLEEYEREEYEGLTQENFVMLIREKIVFHRIPMSHVLIDSIGIGEFVASSPFLEGSIAFKSSYTPIKTEENIVVLPNVGYTKEAPMVSDYKNLRSQCTFKLAHLVNNRLISSKVTGKEKEEIIEELSTYQDDSKGDGKRQVTSKEDIKALIGRSPDSSDTWIMRMFFVIREQMSPNTSEVDKFISDRLHQQFAQRKHSFKTNTNK